MRGDSSCEEDKNQNYREHVGPNHFVVLRWNKTSIGEIKDRLIYRFYKKNYATVVFIHNIIQKIYYNFSIWLQIISEVQNTFANKIPLNFSIQIIII